MNKDVSKSKSKTKKVKDTSLHINKSHLRQDRSPEFVHHPVTHENKEKRSAISSLKIKKNK